MSNEKCQYCGRPLAGEICPAHGYVGNPIPATPVDPATSGVPTGAEMQWPVATPPPGWLIEDGSSQLITDHPALSALIRSTYGGADAYHFYLPDMRGLVPVGHGEGDLGIGGSGGEATHTLTQWESGVPAHTHPRANEIVATAGSGDSSFVAGSHTLIVGTAVAANSGAAASAAHNNLQPYRVRQFVIKT